MFFLAIWILALSYFIGGYWLLNFKQKKEYLIPIIAGIVFGTSLAVLPFAIRTIKTTIVQILPIINVALFIFLGVLTLTKRENDNDSFNYTGILFRSALILVIVCFFSYTPYSLKLHRDIIIFLNYESKEIVANMQMINYSQEFEKAIKVGDCDSAIKFAEKSNNEGKKWANLHSKREVFNIENNLIDSTLLFNTKTEVDSLYLKYHRVISGTYKHLYDAYLCKSKELFSEKKYYEALEYAYKADEVINIAKQNSEHLIIEQAYSLFNIGLCHKEIKNYYLTDSLFRKAIDIYKSAKKYDDESTAKFNYYLAESLSEQFKFKQSNILHKKSIEILGKFSSSDDAKKYILKKISH